MSLAFGIKDLIDIILMALMLYGCYHLMKKSGAGKIFTGIMIFIVIWFLVTKVFRLPLTGAVFNQFVSVGVIAIVVLFQNEIRHFFQTVGAHKWWLSIKSIIDRFQPKNEKEHEASMQTMQLVTACRHMSHDKVGALIVIERRDSIQQYIETGDVFNADINTRLVENIFFKNSPLHDGAMMIRDHHIAAAAAILPVSNNPDIPRHLGLRHRAAMGLSEKCDAIVIIVSEETGNISVAMNAEYQLNLSPEQLQRLITDNTTNNG